MPTVSQKLNFVCTGMYESPVKRLQMLVHEDLTTVNLTSRSEATLGSGVFARRSEASF
nr:MAG TPA: hypothetical protein [Caudoviricetes sp.]